MFWQNWICKQEQQKPFFKSRRNCVVETGLRIQIPNCRKSSSVSFVQCSSSPVNLLQSLAGQLIGNFSNHTLLLHSSTFNDKQAGTSLLFLPEHVFQIATAIAIGQPADIFSAAVKISAQHLIVLTGSKFRTTNQTCPFGVFFLFCRTRGLASQNSFLLLRCLNEKQGLNITKK